MTKQELTADLRRSCNGASFITRTELAAYLGYSCPKRVDRYLQGLERVGKTRYFIPDVAAKVIAYRD